MMSDIAVLLNYSTSVWGASKTDRQVSEEVLRSKGATSRAGKFTKNLLGGTCHELEAIRTLVAEFQAWIRRATFPSQSMGRASVIVPNNKIVEICEKCREYQGRFASLVNDFIDKYEEIVEEARLSLAQLAKDDYPSKEELLSKFSFEFYIAPIAKAADFDSKLGLTELEDMLTQQYESKLHETLKGGEAQLINMIKGRAHKMYESLSKFEGKRGATISQATLDAAIDEIRNVQSLNFRNRTDINEWCQSLLQTLVRGAAHYRGSLICRQEGMAEVRALLLSMGEVFDQPVPQTVGIYDFLYSETTNAR